MKLNLKRGFLPSQDPLTKLPDAFKTWETFAHDLPKRIASKYLRQWLRDLLTLPVAELTTSAELERAMLILSYFAHAYVWSDPQSPATVLPAAIAKPWYQVSKQLQRPPVLSYASYALHNWRRFDTSQEIELNNIALLQNFMAGIDEEWFILIHVDIEARAIPAIHSLQPLQQAIADENDPQIEKYLTIIGNSLQAIYDTMQRMPEYCDPYIYYQRVRPYIHGWKDNPALPQGLIYDGVAAYQNQPQQFKGETGAQSTIIPALDAVLNIHHRDTPLKKHLDEMRIYMPKSHREFLSLLEQGPSLRDFLLKTKQTNLTQLYNDCLHTIESFRQIHLQYAAEYIQKQTQHYAGNPTEVGTGGTPFMTYLSEHRDETTETKL